MTEHESEKRRAEQRRALQVNPEGARVDAIYIHRQQEYVSVSRTDLSDFMELDTVTLVLWSSGGFFFSGATWLFIQHIFDVGQIGSEGLFCLLSMAFGAALGFAGWRMHKMKRRRIEAVFKREAGAA